MGAGCGFSFPSPQYSLSRDYTSSRWSSVSSIIVKLIGAASLTLSLPRHLAHLNEVVYHYSPKLRCIRSAPTRRSEHDGVALCPVLVGLSVYLYLQDAARGAAPSLRLRVRRIPRYRSHVLDWSCPLEKASLDPQGVRRPLLCTLAGSLSPSTWRPCGTGHNLPAS